MRPRIAFALAVAFSLLDGSAAQANCNLIPTAPGEFRSILGTVAQTVAAPAHAVVIRTDLACTPTAPGFDPIAVNNAVTIRFEPPGSASDPSLVTEVLVPAVDVSVQNCGLISGARCDTLRFVMPDTDAKLPPAGDGRGLTGAAEILVRAPDSTLLADIGPLYDPTLSCGDQTLEPVFQHFTVLPALNSFGALSSGANTTLLATLDGGGNLLIPFDYRAVLPEGPGSAVFRILQLSANLDASSATPGVPIRVPDARFLRSFSTIGRPIPPVLDVDQTGAVIFGTVDASESIVRIARLDPQGGGGPLYDLRDRLQDGRGPIVIANAVGVARESAELSTLSADAQSLAFSRNEAVDGDLNGDGDSFDLVPQVVNVATGAGTSSHAAATLVHVPPFVKPALTSGGGFTAFALSEARQGHADLDADVDVFDNLLRVLTPSGADLTATLPQTPVDPIPVIDGKPLEISNGFVFFRTREGDAATRTTELLTPTLLDPSRAARSDFPSLNHDGRFVAFESRGGAAFLNGAPGGNHVYLLDRQTGGYELIDRNAAGNPANGDAEAGATSISADGRFVAYSSRATNLTLDATNGLPHLFVFDRQAHNVECDSCGLLPGTAASLPALSADARFVVYAAGADYVVFDRQGRTATSLRALLPLSGGIAAWEGAGEPAAISGNGGIVAVRMLGKSGTGAPIEDQIFAFDWQHGHFSYVAPGSFPALSGDGRLVSFQSDAALVTDDTNGCPDTYVFDLETQSYERVSVDTEGRETRGGIFPYTSAISEDGRFVAFIDESSGLVPGVSGHQVFRYDRATRTVEAVSVSAAGASSGAKFRSNAIAISGDGRVVAFAYDSQDLVFGDVGLGSIFARANVAAPSLNGADGDSLDTVLQVFDTSSKALRPAARVPADLLAVSAGRTALISSEADDGGVDRNGNGVATDHVARIYDANTDTLRELGVAADRVAISPDVVCLTVPEAHQPPPFRNGDGDALDDVLAVWSIATAPATPANVGVAADAIVAIGHRCVFSTPEAAEGPSGTDLNGDGDTDDRVLRVYDDTPAVMATAGNATGSIRETGLAVADFVAKGDLVAFRVCEAEQGPNGTDLNGDGDTADCVMHVLRLSTGEVVNTHRAAIPCTLPGCDPFFEPYRVADNTVSFLSREFDQSGLGPQLGVGCSRTAIPGQCDLNLDGDNDDVVIQVFDVDSGEAQVLPLSPQALSPEQAVPPFPTTLGGRRVLYEEVPESALGQDVNEDGVIDDTPVVVLVGDVDGDGTLDFAINRADNCVEVPNPTQLDLDRDHLGDGVCDPNPNSVLPGANACDVDANGSIDRNDVNLIFRDRGMKARESDPRDPDRDGVVSVLDVSLCSRRCTNANCEPSPPLPAPAPHCGLLGIEPAVLAGLLSQWKRSARRRKEKRG
jgi:hypothetical protein